MLTRLDLEMAAEDKLTAQCEQVWPGAGKENAQRIIARHEKAVRETLRYVDPILLEMLRSVRPTAPVAGSPRVSFPGEAGIGAKSAK